MNLSYLIFEVKFKPFIFQTNCKPTNKLHCNLLKYAKLTEDKLFELTSMLR